LNAPKFHSRVNSPWHQPRQRSVSTTNAYNLYKAHGYNVSLNLPWALQDALMDIPPTRLPADVKQQLRQRLEPS